MTARFVIIGHVDHGKSTLAGHLLYKAGHYTEHEIEKTTNEATSNRWKWAHLLDTSTEERVRSKTHEYSIIPFTYEGNKYELVDTPGHSSFVRQTIQGISALPNVSGVLVISAIENEFHSGFNTGMIKEQCILARASGVEHLIVAVNKMDKVKWDSKVLLEIKISMNIFLKSLKFKSVEFVPISAYDGIGILELLNKIPKDYSNIVLTNECDSYECVDKLNVILKVLNCDNIITLGYECIVHYQGKEYECIVTKIKRKAFLRIGDLNEVILSFVNPIPSHAKRIILRKNEKTIGFGIAREWWGEKREGEYSKKPPSKPPSKI